MVAAPLRGRVVQYGYVVKDLEREMDRWQRLYPIGPFFMLPKVPVSDGIYRGQPMELTMTAALAQLGDVQIELLFQHTDGPSALTETPAPDVGAALNHFNMLTNDIEGDLAVLEAQGFPLVMRGIVLGGMPFAYVDTAALTGHFTELAPATPELLEIFDEVRRAAIDWDGRDPVRSF